MNLKLSTVSQIPIYQQIKDQIKNKVLSNQWQEGFQLPSIRSLARTLKVGVITTTKAYDELVIEGYIISRPGIGFFVNKIDYAEIKTKYRDNFKSELKEIVNKTYGTPISIEDLMDIIQEIKEEVNE